MVHFISLFTLLGQYNVAYANASVSFNVRLRNPTFVALIVPL
jgi:hypothetical protein